MRHINLIESIVRRTESWLSAEDREWLRAITGEVDAIERSHLAWTGSAIVGVVWACQGPRRLIVALIVYGALLAAATIAALSVGETNALWMADTCAMILASYLAAWCFAVRIYSGATGRAMALLLVGLTLSGVAFATWPAIRFDHDSYNAAVAWVLRGGPVLLAGFTAIACYPETSRTSERRSCCGDTEY